MSGQDSHLFLGKSSGTSGVSRPSKLPLFGKRSSEKHPPPTSQPPISSTFTTSSLGRVRPSTVVRPFFAAQYQPVVNSDAQRRRYPASQPSTPVRGGQAEMNQEFQQLHRSAHFLRPGAVSDSSTPKRSENSGAIYQSIAFPGSRHVAGNLPSKSSKSKSYRMENMSLDHLQYLERRLQQLLETMPFRPVLPAKAKSDSGRQSAHPSWVSNAHLHHHHRQALHYPVVATPLHYHPQTTPLFLLPPQSAPQPPPSPPPPASELPLPHPTVSGPGFGDIDPYYLSSPSSASSCYAGSTPSSLQDFNRDELTCLLHAVRNMLSMHQQNQPSSTSNSTSTLDPLSALQHRPFSWCLHRTADTTASSSPAPSTVNLFLGEDDSVNVEATGDGGVATDDSEEEEEGKQNNSAADGGPHPPLLPPGFRDFSRYLDSKFGPDSTEEQRSRHHHHQRRRHREIIDNNTAVPVVTTNSTNGGNRGRSTTDVRPKISITTCSGDTGPYSDLVPFSHESICKTTAPTTTSGEDNELTQRLVPTWCAPYWCSPPPPNAGQPVSWYHQVTPPPPPPNAAAACWFRAAANHFATAAAIFAADNAAAASVLASPHQLPPPFPHPTDPAFVDRTCERRTPAATSSSTVHRQNTSTTSSSYSLGPTLYPPLQFIGNNSIRNGEEEEGDEFSLASDEEEQQQGRRRCQRRSPAVEPLQRQLWGRRSDDLDSTLDGSQAADDGGCAVDMLPQDPALIQPDQVDFYAQIKVVGGCSNDILICSFFMVKQ